MTVYPIALVTQTFPPKKGGMEAVMASIADHLSCAGFEVSVYADKRCDSVGDYKFWSLEGLKWTRARRKRSLISKTFDQSGIFICDSWKSVAAIPSQATHIIVLAHGQEYLEAEKKYTRIRNALERAESIVCSSTYTQKLIDNNFSEFTNNTQVIYPCYMVESPKNLKQEANESSHLFSIVSICRIEKRKGLRNSAIALSRLLSTGYKFKWSIAGTGPDLEHLKALIRSLEMDNAVSILGRVNDYEKHSILCSADLFLMPSYQEGNSLEGFGISYTEAASYGIPAIAGIAGGAPEAVLDNQTGWCADGASVDSVLSAIKDSMDNPEKRLQFGKRASMRFNNVLAGSKAFEKLLETIKSIKEIK